MKVLFKGASERFYIRGDLIDTDDYVMYIESGAVAVYGEADNSNFIFAFKAGEVFPMVRRDGQFLNGRKLFYKALTNTKLLALPRADYTKRADQPEIASEINDRLVSTIENMYSRVDNLALGTVRERLLYRLNFLAERLGSVVRDKVIIETPMPHTELAASINTSRETVNRLMKDLEKEGLISLRNQVIIINSLKKLNSELKPADSGAIRSQATGMVLTAGLALDGVHTLLS